MKPIPSAPSSTVCLILLCTLSSAVAYADDLYSGAAYDALAADHRALRVGDNLTVVVTEVTNATADARTSIDKAASLSASLDLHNRPNQGKLTANNTFNGGGQTERTDKLLARLTVSVLRVEPDGSLRVKGEQEITINGERQKFLLEGRVRTQDVGQDNTVLSSRLSEAKISYTGRGILNEGQRPGLITRLLSWLRLL
jgi:flagellar L-ring protein precursor FlgH